MINISNIVFEVLSAVLYLLVMVALPVLLGFIQIHAQKRSSVCIDAKCVGNTIIVSKGVMFYEPQFAYDFDCQQYFCGVSQIVSEPYEEGQIYEIYVNPEKPSEFVLFKCKPISGYVVIGIGLLFFAVFVCEIVRMI